MHTLKYHELDFPETTAKKIHAIERAPFLKALLLGNEPVKELPTPTLRISEDKTGLSSTAYHIHPIDLRTLAPSSSAIESSGLLNPNFQTIPDIEPSTPTLILSECCLTYLPSHVGSAMLQHLTSNLLERSTPVLTVLYEPLHPNDAFGRTMTRNLRGRGIEMPSLLELETLEAHGTRLTACLGAADGVAVGWKGVEVRQAWKEWVSEEEKERLRILEGLDEEEEWELLAGHYGIVWAWRGLDGSAFGE